MVDFRMVELKKVLEFCADNNCAFEYNPGCADAVDITVNGTLTDYQVVSVSLRIDFRGNLDSVELYIKKVDEDGQFIDLPYRDVLTCLDDIVARYQL